MHAEVRHLHSPDIDPDTFAPEDPDRFAFLVRVTAGPAGGAGEESFDFTVGTTAWLRDLVRRAGPTPGRHHLVVDGFDWTVLQAFFHRLATRCTGADWPEVAAQLGRYGHRESEDRPPA